MVDSDALRGAMVDVDELQVRDCTPMVDSRNRDFEPARGYVVAGKGLHSHG